MSGELLYRDVEGLLHEKAEVSRHHAIPRCRTRGIRQRRFVNSYGLVLPMLNEWHNQGDTALHNNVPLAKMPSDRTRHVIQEFMRQDDTMGVYSRFFAITDFVIDLADRTSDVLIGREAERLAENFMQQGPFVLNGMVEVVNDTRV